MKDIDNIKKENPNAIAFHEIDEFVIVEYGAKKVDRMFLPTDEEQIRFAPYVRGIPVARTSITLEGAIELAIEFRDNWDKVNT